MDSIEGQARASHSWTLLSSPHQGMQASSNITHMPANAHACKWTPVQVGPTPQRGCVHCLKGNFGPAGRFDAHDTLEGFTAILLVPLGLLPGACRIAGLSIAVAILVHAGFQVTVAHAGATACSFTASARALGRQRH